MPGSDNQLRIAILGCGRIADLQTLGYRSDPRARIHAACDIDGQLAEARRLAWGASVAYARLEELLADDAVDAVEILTPHHLHAEQAIACLRAGKHVSLQKPPTRTLAELAEIERAARESGRVVRVFENFMHYPPHRKAKALIDEGAIGEPISIRIKTAAGSPDTGWEISPASQAWRYDTARCGGGATTFDHGYHCFNMARFFMPVEISTVHAFIHWTELAENARIDGPALISWRYQGDTPRFGSWEVIASLGMHVRSKYYVSDDRTEIHGTGGIVWINRCTGKLLEEPSVVVYRDGQTRAFHDLETDWADSFRAGGVDFIDALLDGRSPAQTIADARQTLAVALAAAKSAAEGRETDVSEILADSAQPPGASRAN